MSDINNVTLTGRLTRDPEVRYTQSGMAFCKFGLAVNERWKDKQGAKQEKAHFIDCTVWGNLAEVVGQYVKKGHRFGVTGKLQHETWEKDGQKHSKVGVNVRDITFLEGKSRQEQQPQVADDGIPF